MTKLKIFENRYISVIAGSSGASAIIFFSYPFLALVYSVESFGLLGVINAYSLILSTLIVLRFDYFILSAKSKSLKVRYLFVACIMSSLFSVFVFFIGIGYWYLCSSIDVIYVALLMVLYSFNNIYNFYLVSIGRIRGVNTGKFIKAIVTVAVQVLSFYYVDEVYGLIVGVASGLFFAVSYLFIQLKSDALRQLVRFKYNDISFFNILSKSVRHNKFHIKLQLPQTGLNSITNNAMPIVIELLFDLKVAGALLLVEKFIKMPVGLIIEAVRPLLISELSKESVVQASDKVIKLIVLLFTSGVLSFLLFIFIDVGSLDIDYVLYKEVAYLIFPVFIMSISIMCSSPIFCFFQSHGFSKSMFKVEVFRFGVVSFICLMFYHLEIYDEVFFYYCMAFTFSAVPLSYFMYLKILGMRFN